MSKTEKTGYKTDFEFWPKTISACSNAFHKWQAAAKGDVPQSSQ